MKEFTKTQKKYRWPEIKALLSEQIGEEKTNEIFEKAKGLSEQYLEKTQNLKGFEKAHADAAYQIAALYLPLREAIGSEQAIDLLDRGWKDGALAKNAKYNKIPSKLFIKLCRYIAENAFGNKAGFVREDISKDKTEVRFNVTSCPYVRIMSELDRKEACPIVCHQDEYTYGNLHGVAFERSKTLGRGDEVCDFCYRLKNKGE